MDEIQVKTHKDIIALYAAFGITLMLSVIPMGWAALAATALGLSVLITAYVMRGKAEKDSFAHSHAHYVIRTIWIGSAVAACTVLVGSVYLFFNIDNAPLMPCIERFSDPAVIMQAQNIAGLEALFGECLAPYKAANMTAFIIGGLICAGPPLLYFVVRFIKGARAALKDAPIKL